MCNTRQTGETGAACNIGVIETMQCNPQSLPWLLRWPRRVLTLRMDSSLAHIFAPDLPLFPVLRSPSFHSLLRRDCYLLFLSSFSFAGVKERGQEEEGQEEARREGVD